MRKYLKITIKDLTVFALSLTFILMLSFKVQAQVTADFSYVQTCKDLVFTDESSTTLGTIDTWEWDFGDGNTSNIQNPTHTFASGSYNVTLTVTTDNLASDSYAEVVDIIPIANFTFDQFCDSVSFLDSSTPNGEITAWDWDFGDGGTSIDEDPQHVYSNHGTYNVHLEVTHNSGCTDTISQQVDIIPKATFSYIQTCDTFNFTDESTPLFQITSWEWDFGDGGSSTDPSPLYIYPVAGNYLVKLIVTHSSGCMDSTTQLVDIVPVADFTYVQSCNSFTFTDASTPVGDITEWNWDFGDGTNSTFQNPPAHDYLISGLIDVELLVTHSSGCKDSITQQINIIPVADFTYDQFCDSIEFFDASTPVGEITTWEWDFDDGTPISYDQYPIHVYANPGTYFTELIVTHTSTCKDTITQEIIIPDIEAEFTFDQICDSVYFFDASSSTAGIEFWEWDFGDGGFSNDTNPAHLFPSNGEYEVILTITDSLGCVLSPNKPDTINTFHSLPGFNSQIFCFTDSTIFINETDSQDVEVQSWFWDFDDPASGPENTSVLFEPKHSFSKEGNFFVELFAMNINGCLDSITQTVTIDTLPEPLFTYEYATEGQPTNFTDLSVSHGSYIYNKYWDWGDETNSVNINPVLHVYDTCGVFNVCLGTTALNGCTDTLCLETKVACTPIADFSYVTYNVTGEFSDSTIVDTLTLIDSWYWTFHDSLNIVFIGESYEQNPIFIFPDEGFYNACLTVTDTLGGTDDTCMLVYIGNAIIAHYIYDEDICIGDSAIFIENSYSPVGANFTSWYWDFDDGSDSTYFVKDTIMTHYFELTGDYSVLMIVTADYNNGEVTDSIRRTVSVHSNPVAYFDSVGVCKGEDSYFYDLSDPFGDTLTNWYWNFGDGTPINTAQNPIHHYNEYGTFFTNLVVATQFGCTDTMVQNSHVSYAPQITFDIENQCLNSPTRFIPNFDSTYAITSWFWEFGDSRDTTTSTEESPTHIYTEFAIYQVSMTASSFGCDSPPEINPVFPKPIPYSDFNMNPNYGGSQGKVQFVNGSIYAETYLWDFGNGQSSTVESPIEVYEDDSTYIITLISKNEYQCADTSRMEYELFFKGLYFPTAFSPNNPNSGVSLFTPHGINLAKYHVQVFDMRGTQLWESEEIDGLGRPIESWDGYYDGTLMPQGLYLWRATATFTNGTIWQGTTLQNNEEPQMQGTVTLIR